MIKPRQKQKIIKAYGKHYSTPIIALLNRAKMKNRNGLPYSKESIRKIVCGIDAKKEHIEIKILADVEKKLAKK